MLNSPKVSVILPNYNYERYLHHRINSILNQTFSDFELIIIDDASTDNSKDVINYFQKIDDRIRLLYCTKNSSNPFSQWKKGLELAKSKYIWIAEADDYCKETLLSQLYNSITYHNTDISYCQSIIVDEYNNELGLWSEKKNINNIFKNNFIAEGHEFIENHLIFENVIPNASAVLFNKISCIKSGGIETSVTSCSDWLLWLKILSKGSISYINQPLNYFRLHEKSVIARLHKKSKFHEFYSSTMRIKYKQYLKKSKKNKTIHNINNYYIYKDIFNKIKWEWNNKKKILSVKHALVSFLMTGELKFIKRILK